MIDKLYNLVLGENGFLVKLRCKNEFDSKMYDEIKTLLTELIKQWKSMELIPKKALLIIAELIDSLSGGNNFLKQEDDIKVEDADIEIKDIINGLYTE